MRLGIKEKDIQKGILEYLSYRKGFFWRNNSGGFRDIKNHFYRFGLKGSPDILGIIPPDGRLVAIEVKSATGQMTDDQRWFQEQVEKHGGVYVLARSVQDVIERNL